MSESKQESPNAPVTAPPDGGFPAPPVTSTAMGLPFGELSWENFERLCYRLAQKVAQVEEVRRYGRQGQAQQGIDVFARKANGRYEVWQAKRYKTFSVAQLRKAIKAFLQGGWVTRTDRLVIAVQTNLDDTKIQDEIELQIAALAKRKIVLTVLGGDGLTDQTRPHPALVHAFFGRAWSEAFYGAAVDPTVVKQLDGEEFARIRAQLTRVYMARFSDLDQGIISSRFAATPTLHKPIALLDRYAMTDVYVRERLGQAPSMPAWEQAALERAITDRPMASPAVRDEVRRTPVAAWLSDGEQIAIVADAGAGKSTLLRCIALDLLTGQAIFPALAARWGDKLPIVVSFAKWARVTAEKGGEVSLKELVAASLQPLLTVDLVALINRAIDEGRIVLIVDGLDEWSAEQAARLTLQTLLTYVEVHGLPTVVSGRPQGLNKIGTLPQTWKSAELAPLSSAQQRQLAGTWFKHLSSEPIETGLDAEVRPSAYGWETERFLKELQAEPALGELAQTPLLFVGLLALAVRNVALPRNRIQALQSLIKLLLEIHPDSRATSAGDVRSRFNAAASSEVRQAALAALAFASRRDGGDAGYARVQARQAIREHLISANGYDDHRADAVADEVLAVNAETVGLLVEKAPGDVGFVHASLEEFLCAVHVQSWCFSDLLSFVGANAGNPRWRNALRNLVGLNPRTSEIDEIVTAIETAEVDALGQINRRQLLAEITFNPSAMRSATAQRLADAAFAVIEGSGPDTEKTTLLRLALNGLSDPALGARIDDRVRQWAPRRLTFSQNLFNALRFWPVDGTLLEILLEGLKDEDFDGARTAAHTLVLRFSGDETVGETLRALIGGASDLKLTAVALEALVRGWPGPETTGLVEAARRSRSALLRAVAIWARVFTNTQTSEDKRECLQQIGFYSPLNYWERTIAQNALFAGWPDDDDIVSDAIDTLGHGPHPMDSIDRDLAVAYLLNTTPGRPNVEQWILDQLDTEHPFILLGGQTWAPLLAFCEASPAIREKVVAHILAGKKSYREREVWELIARLKDTRLRDHAIELMRTPKFGSYWSLLALVEGWSDDPDVAKVFQEVIAMDDEKIDMLAALLPRLYADPAEARARLIRIAGGEKARWDLIAEALAYLGCDGSDAEAVAALAPRVMSASAHFWSPDVVFALFASSPVVRDAAVHRLGKAEPPLHFIAQGFPQDPVVRNYVANVVRAAPRPLRSVITAASGTGGDRHPVLYELLQHYDVETDFQLRIQLCIDFCKLRDAKGPTDDLVALLIDGGHRRGVEYQEWRATAFAGLTALNRTGEMPENLGPDRKISLGSYHRGGVSSALCSLIVDRWDALKLTFGDKLAETKFETLDGPAWASLVRFAGSSPTARRDFLDWCARTDQIGLSELNALAEFSPRSDVLRDHALRVLDRGPDMDGRALPLLVTAAEILRDQFSSAELIERFRAALEQEGRVTSAIVLSILAPGHPLLQTRLITALEIGQVHNDWTMAVEFAARLEPPPQLVATLHGMANRRTRATWDKGVPLLALIERVMHDPATRDALRLSLDPGGDLTPSAFCASAAVLSAAGWLDAEGLDLCAARLTDEQANPSVPVAVLDIATDETRPLTHVLTDLLQARSGL